MKNKDAISSFNFFEKLSDNLKIKLYSFFTTPLLLKVSPRIDSFDKNVAIVSIPLNRSTKNIYKSMYFGAINIGAELCVFYIIHKLTKNLKTCRVISQHYSIDFIKKPKGRVFFYCDEVQKVAQTIDNTIKTGKESSVAIKGHGYVLSNAEEQTVCRFTVNIYCSVQVKI
ncbi:DUF4442 domain-containing protein [Marinomonas transparens]|uniref:DUF4442 domain-containing protein n=1 Tax=Marinomonas transparens TaxID=2795388 RepID=A0A934JNX2_9GAMM|nr:DUF4442 domain-containing protein [Marinomonas transparens]MBJ7539715.1 DUF4442 domain-containing protein [Marinomonas transparens]